MEYIGIGICVIAVVAICIFIVQRKKHAQEANSNENVKTNAEECAIAVSNDTPTELVIEMEMLPAEAIKDENALVEITDSKVLAHVNNLVPGLVQAGNAANNAAQAVQAANGGVLYRAIIPAGAKLTDSKAYGRCSSRVLSWSRWHSGTCQFSGSRGTKRNGIGSQHRRSCYGSGINGCRPVLYDSNKC